MTTKALIELLQKEDPEGNIHVRINGECPSFVERKAGYWDGSYSYVENDDYQKGKYIDTTKNDKIDIYTLSLEDYLHDHKGDISMIQFEFDSSTDLVNREKANHFWKKVKKIIAAYQEEDQRFLKEFTFHILRKMQEGWAIFQDHDKEVGGYNAMYYQKGKETIRLCQGEYELILDSGFFRPIIIERKNVVWKLISKMC